MLSEAGKHRTGKPIHRTALSGIFLLFFTLGLVTAALGAALPSLRETYELGARGGGWLVSIYNLGALIAILACGFGNRRLPQRTTLSSLMALFVAGATIMGVSESWPVFCSATVVCGAGYGGLVLYLNSIVARRFDDQSLLMLSVINAVFGIGAILGPLAVSAAEDHVRAVFLVTGLASIPALAICTISEEPPAPRLPVQRAHDSQMRLLLAFLGLGLLYAGLETGVGAWEATHLDWTGHTASRAAGLASLFWVGLCVGRFILPALFRHRPTESVVRGSLLAALASLIIAAHPQAAPYAYAACGLFLAPVFPAALKWIADSVIDNQTANALFFTASMVGSVVFPALIGAIASPDLAVTIPLSIATIAVLSLLITQYLAKITRPPQ